MRNAGQRSVIVAVATMCISIACSKKTPNEWLTHAAAPIAPPAPLVGEPPDFTAIVRRYGPAVVNVRVVQHRPTLGGGSAESTVDPDMSDVSGTPLGSPDGMVRGVASGFIVRSEGVVITNAHAVENASQVTVRLTDRREFQAKVVGVDAETDVAVLRIDARGLPTVRIGDDARVRVGEWVVAIGSPFGFDNSVTAGVVSARARSLPDQGYIRYLQTDVPVNPGNSGGPLFDLAGNVIGINSAIYSQSGGYMGISFAVPIGTAMDVAQQLLRVGKVTRGWLGVSVQDVTQDLARSFRLGRPRGALVTGIGPDSPAARGGARTGDVILSLNGQPIPTADDLPPRVADLRPGSVVHVQVWRDGRKRDIEVNVGEAKPATEARTGPASGKHEELDLAVRTLTQEEQRRADTQGCVQIIHVSPAAARAGLLLGDVVLAINDRAVTSPEDLRALVSAAHGMVALLVQRGRARLFVPVEFG